MGQFSGLGCTHFENNFGPQSGGGIDDLCASCDISLVGHAGGDARTGLNADRVALGHQFFHRLGGRGNARFSDRGFGWYAYLHKSTPEGTKTSVCTDDDGLLNNSLHEILVLLITFVQTLRDCRKRPEHRLASQCLMLTVFSPMKAITI
jgi:hypothetical protein